MTKFQSTACGLALALAAAFTAAQAQAQPSPPHLPAPPMVPRPVFPQQPFCFRDAEEAHAWIDASYRQLGDIAHDRQAVDAYVVALKVAMAGQPDDVRDELQTQVNIYEGQSVSLTASYGFAERLIQGAREVKYCPPERRAAAPRLVVPLEIGFSFFEGRRVRVLDNRDRTHTVIREAEGRRTEERLADVSRR